MTKYISFLCSLIIIPIMNSIVSAQVIPINYSLSAMRTDNIAFVIAYPVISEEVLFNSATEMAQNYIRAFEAGKTTQEEAAKFVTEYKRRNRDYIGRTFFNEEIEEMMLTLQQRIDTISAQNDRLPYLQTYDFLKSKNSRLISNVQVQFNNIDRHVVRNMSNLSVTGEGMVLYHELRESDERLHRQLDEVEDNILLYVQRLTKGVLIDRSIDPEIFKP